MGPEHPVVGLVLIVIVFVNSVEGLRTCSILVLVDEASLPAVPTVRVFIHTDDGVGVREQEFELRCPVLGKIENVLHQARMHTRLIQQFLDCFEVWFFFLSVMPKDEYRLNIWVEEVVVLVDCSENTLCFRRGEWSVVDLSEPRR